MIKHEWLKTLLITLISVTLTTTLNYYVWKKQFIAGKEQIEYEHKLNTLEKVSKDGARMIYLMSFKDRIELERIRVQAQLAHVSISEYLLGGIDLGYKQTYEIQKRLQKANTFIYTNYIAALDFQQEYSSTMLTTLNFYSDSTASESQKLNHVMSLKHFQEKILELIKNNKVSASDPDEDTISSVLMTERDVQLNSLITVMRSEI